MADALGLLSGGWLPVLVLVLPPLVLQCVAPVPRLDSDAIEYYAHLRSLYFDHDVQFENEFRHFGILSRWDKTNLTVTGHRRTNFSVGPALLWMPFYAVGDVVARFLDDVEDGYSPSHIRAVCLGSLVYGLLGLLLLRRLLEEIVSREIAFFTAFALLYSTFLFWYLVYEPVMSHAGSFFLAALALVLWWPGREALTARRGALLGLVLGLATTVRWQNALLLLLPAATLLRQLGRDRRRAVVAASLVLLAFFVGVLPQLLVFKAIFGEYVFTYPIQGRDYLRLDRPAWLETFFSSRHGLLFWTPVLWGGFLGYLILLRRHAALAWATLPPLLLMTWVNAASGDWWGGGGYSNRRFDSVLPFLALGLAVLLARVGDLGARRPVLLLGAGGSLLTVWNLLFMTQYRENRIPRDEPVSFPRVTETNAEILAEWVGSPVAWPANWLFARRHALPAAQYDLMVGKYLFHRQNNLGGVVDLGDDRSDPALLGEGWSARRACGPAVCRAVLSRARLFAPLDVPETLDVTVRAQGDGHLDMAVNGQAVAEFPLSKDLVDRSVRVAAARFHGGLNEIALAVSPPGSVLVDRVTFERVKER